MNVGLGRPRSRHNSGNKDPERAFLPSLPTATHFALRAALPPAHGGGHLRNWKGGQRTSRVPLSHRRHCPISSQAPAPGALRLCAPLLRCLLLSRPRGSAPEKLEISAVYFGDTVRPPPELVLHHNFLLLGQPECPLARGPAPSPGSEGNRRNEVPVARLRPRPALL